MKRRKQVWVLFLSVALAGCGAATDDSKDSANVEAREAAAPKTAKVELPPCPFRQTRNWKGSVEGGRLLVNGFVDVQMAGMKPQLVPRDSAPPVARFDLSLVPEAGAAVTDFVRYETTGAPRYRRGEIWCGGEKIEDFEMVLVE